MNERVLKYLYDIKLAIREIDSFFEIEPRHFDNYRQNILLKRAIEAKQLKDHVESNDFKDIVPKYPKKKKQLEELAKSLTEFDNPVLMFVTFNKIN